MRLAPDLGEAHLALALCFYRIDRDYDAALKELCDRRARLCLTTRRFWMSPATSIAGKAVGGRRWRCLSARRISIRAAPNFEGLPTTLRVLRQWAMAADAFSHALQLEPNLPEGWTGLAYVRFAESGSAAVAIETLARLPEAQKTSQGPWGHGGTMP